MNAIKKLLKPRFILLSLILFLSSYQANAKTSNGLEDFLKGFVSEISNNNIDFFYASQPKEDLAYVYWMTGNSILIVNLPAQRLENYGWYNTKARIDLNSHLVPTADDIGSSTYLTDPEWAEKQIEECLNGEKFVIRKEDVELLPSASLY